MKPLRSFAPLLCLSPLIKPILAGGRPKLMSYDDLNSVAHFKYPCRKVYLLFAKGSISPGNVGMLVGPELADKLRDRYPTPGDLGIQGLNYDDSLMNNFKDQLLHPQSVNETRKYVKEVTAHCPQSWYIFAGYSQGAALMWNLIPNLPIKLRQRIVAGALIGNSYGNITSIAGYPTNRYVDICKKGDVLCEGKRFFTWIHHFMYGMDNQMDPLVEFFTYWIGVALEEGKGWEIEEANERGFVKYTDEMEKVLCNSTTTKKCESQWRWYAEDGGKVYEDEIDIRLRDFKDLADPNPSIYDW